MLCGLGVDDCGFFGGEVVFCVIGGGDLDE